MQKQGELQFLGAVAYGVEEMFVPFGIAPKGTKKSRPIQWLRLN